MLKEAISIGEQMLNTNKKNMDGALLHNLAIAYSKLGTSQKLYTFSKKLLKYTKKNLGNVIYTI